MPTYQLTITRQFCVAHAIRLPDGTIEPVHGHNWPVAVTIASGQLDEAELVMDFHALQRSVDQLLERVHNRNLNELPPFTDGAGGIGLNPTAERVAWWLGTELAGQLPEHVRLVSVSVGEAPGCTATYQP